MSQGRELRLGASISTPVGVEYSADYKNMLQLIQLRWTAVIGQIATIVAVAYGYRIALPLRGMAAVLVFLVGFNLVSAWRYRVPRIVVNGELLLALLIDVATLTLQLHFSGGTTNPFVFLYLLQVILASMLLKPRFTWLVVATTFACIAGLALLSKPLALPLDHNRGLSSLYVQGMLICFLLNAILLVTFINRINRNVRARDARLADLRQRAAEHEHIVRMGLLASGAAHELGTPLSIMSVIVGDWRHQPQLAANADVQGDIDEIETQLHRCKTIVAGILQSTRETHGESATRTTLITFFDDLAQHWRATRPAGAFVYHNRIVRDTDVAADPTIRQMIDNVLDNALEASPAWVGLTVDADADVVWITVEDRGPGFTATMLANYGKPYHSTKHRPGAGLGMFLVLNVARTLGGSVGVRNRIEGGAEVVMTIPLSAIADREGG